jgi:hypothetical protein
MNAQYEKCDVISRKNKEGKKRKKKGATRKRTREWERVE